MVLAFGLYEDQETKSSLWAETQTVQLDEQGHYSVQLGSTTPEGLPLRLFRSGKPLWLEVQEQNPEGAEQPRVLLVSVPYALKGADADTLGGKPAQLTSPSKTLRQLRNCGGQRRRERMKLE